MVFSNEFVKQLMDPIDSDGDLRYPDETLAKTCLVKMAYTENYVVPTLPVLPGQNTNFFTSLQCKVFSDVAGQTLNPTPTGALPIIGPDWMFDPIGTSVPALLYTAYPQLAQFLSLDSSDRTLGCAIRVKLNGLPASTFAPTGAIYCIQLGLNEIPQFQDDVHKALTGSPLGTPAPYLLDGQAKAEAYVSQYVTAGKGFSFTLNDLAKAPDGSTHALLPAGPQQFLFSDCNALPAVFAGLGQAGYIGPVGPNFWSKSQIVSANPMLMMIGFGIQPGTVLQFDYAHIVEYIPSVSSAGILRPELIPPSTIARDSIAKEISAIAEGVLGKRNLFDVIMAIGNVTGQDMAAFRSTGAKFAIDSIQTIGTSTMQGAMAGGWAGAGAAFANSAASIIPAALRL